jgi:hypothetical protein
MPIDRELIACPVRLIGYNCRLDAGKCERNAQNEKLHQCGVDASEALRAAADILTDSSIAFDRRLQAHRRCVA